MPVKAGTTIWSPIHVTDVNQMKGDEAFFASGNFQYTDTPAPSILFVNQSGDIVLPSGGRTSLTIGFRIDEMVFGATSANSPFCQFRTLAGAVLADLTALKAGGVVQLRNGSTQVAVGPSAADGKYFEIWLNLHDSTGASKAYVDGSEQWDVSGVDTLNGSGACEVIRLRWPDLGGSADLLKLSSFYIHTEGELFLDPIVITYHPVNIDSTPTDWTPTFGAGESDDFEALDENPPDGVSYISSNTNAQKSRFGMTNATGTGLIVAVAPVAVGRRATPGTGNVKLLLDSNASPTTPTSLAPPTSSYAVLLDKAELQDPDGPAAWSEAAVNALEIEPEYVS